MTLTSLTSFSLIKWWHHLFYADVVMNLKWDNVNGKRRAQPLAPRNVSTAITGMMATITTTPLTVTPSGMSNYEWEMCSGAGCITCIMYVSLVYQAHGVTPDASPLSELRIQQDTSAFQPLITPSSWSSGSQERADCSVSTGLCSIPPLKAPQTHFEPIKTWEERQVRSGDYVG